MPHQTIGLKHLLGIVILLLHLWTVPVASATDVISADSTDTTAIPEDHPNLQPYETSYNIAQHILALPSTLFYWGTRPIGWGVQYAETRFPHLFEGERGDFGFFPLFESGSQVRFAAGALLFHQHLFRQNHEARIQFLYGTDNYWDVNAQYRVPVSQTYSSELLFSGNYERNPRHRFFIDDSRLFYSAEDATFRVRYNSSLSARLRMQNSVTYSNHTARTSSAELQDKPITFPDELKGNYEILTFGNQFTLDFRRGEMRKVSGTQLIAGTDLATSLKNSTSYLTYHIEAHQFIPVPFLPESRRFGIRGKLLKSELLSGDEVPFFDLPTLGGSRDLRGFRSDRFRGNGALIFTAEYRYPMWDVLDVTLFMDQGQVFNNFSDIAFDRFEPSYGFGVHLLTAKGLAFRAEMAFSSETSRYILSITPTF